MKGLQPSVIEACTNACTQPTSKNVTINLAVYRFGLLVMFSYA